MLIISRQAFKIEDLKSYRIMEKINVIDRDIIKRG